MDYKDLARLSYNLFEASEEIKHLIKRNERLDEFVKDREIALNKLIELEKHLNEAKTELKDCNYPYIMGLLAEIKDLANYMGTRNIED